MTVGGSIQEVSIKGRTFAASADADATRKLGGFENEVQANGDGTTRTVKMRMPWNFGGLVLDINDARGDQEFLQGIANAEDNVDISITYASGKTYQGTGTIIGEIVTNSQASTAAIEVGGPGEATAQ